MGFSSEIETLITRYFAHRLDGVSSAGLSCAEIARRFNRYRLSDQGSSHVAYLKKMVENGFTDELRLSSGLQVGHMAGNISLEIADLARLMTLLNLNVVKEETAKVASQVERETIAMLHHEIYGFDSAFYEETTQSSNACLGHFTSGGTTANFEALWVARNHVLQEVEASGVVFPVHLKGVSYKRPIILASEMVHYSVEKAAGLLGLGRSNVCKIPTTTGLKVDTVRMRQMLARAVNDSNLPVAIVATAGTTESGSFDDLQEIADIAETFGVHLHVDAAWGGAAIFTQIGRRLMSGIERADTVTIDAHKQLETPMGAGMVFYKNPVASKAIQTTQHYIIRADSADIGRNTLEGSRAAVAHYTHMYLCTEGREGVAKKMRATLSVAIRFARLIESRKRFDLVLFPESNILNFRYMRESFCGKCVSQLTAAELSVIEQDNIRLQEAVKLDGRVLISRTMIRDHRRKLSPYIVVLRSVINTQVTLSSAIQALDIIEQIGQSLLSRPFPVIKKRGSDVVLDAS